MKKRTYVTAVTIGCMLIGFSFPAYAHASDGEDYITISVDAVDDNANLKYALDSDDEAAFTDSNEFTVPAGTSHTIYVKDAAGNITSQKYEPEAAGTYITDPSYDADEETQQINIDLELGRKEEKGEIYSPDEEGNPGTASVTDRTKTDGSVDAEKVFYTFSTKEGEELYLVVDQGRGTDNVYLLDTVSLGDLRVLADGHDTSSAESDDKEEDNLLSTLREENSNTETEELQTEKPRSSFGNGLIILLVAVIGGGAYYYLKIYHNKKNEAMDAMDAMDMDEFEPEEEEEEAEFDYDDAEKEQYLEKLINEESEEEEFLDQDPDEYAMSYNDDGEDSGSEDDDEDLFEDDDIESGL